MDALDAVMTALHKLQGIHSASLLAEDQQPFLEAKEALRLWLAEATAPTSGRSDWLGLDCPRCEGTGTVFKDEIAANTSSGGDNVPVTSDANRTGVVASDGQPLRGVRGGQSLSGEVPEGMKPWHGGDSAPPDWDGRRVLLRDGRRPIPDENLCWRRGAEGMPSSGDIIAYTPSQRLDAATVERCAQVADERATARRADEAKERLAGGDIETAIVCARVASTAESIAAAIRALATEPHQHGGKA